MSGLFGLTRGGLGLPVVALALVGVGLSQAGCTQGDGDTDSDTVVDDSAETDDSATDDSAEPDPEVCGSGQDEDGDGLVDCADPDCTDSCDEDCGNGVDDDADGAVDCLDKECDQDPVCLGAFSIEAELRFDTLTLRFGPDVEAELGEVGTADGVGSIVLRGTANTDEGADFTCEGNVVAQPVAEGGAFPAFALAEEACASCDYGMTMTLAPLWPGSCPVLELPAFNVAAKDGQAGLYLEQSGEWSYFFKGSGSWSDQGNDRVADLSDVVGGTLSWDGDY